MKRWKETITSKQILKSVQTKLVLDKKQVGKNVLVWLKQCQQNLINCVNEYHCGDKTIFGFDIKSYYYFSTSNITHDHSIRTFRSILSRMVDDNRWKAADKAVLQRRIYQKFLECFVKLTGAGPRHLHHYLTSKVNGHSNIHRNSC